MWRLE
jgi:ABC-type bacteriocin/lantibiotic exporter with double-glycine peptidase domain